MIMLRARMVVLLFLAISLSGCLYGQCLDGPCALERERIIKSIKPYIAYWEKAGMTEEERRQDWVVCGGQKNGSFAWDSRKKIPDETDDDARTRLQFEFQRCMLRAGYHYTGNCTSEYMKSRPLCGAP